MPTWNESLRCGVIEVDNQHKELFRKIDGLQHAMSQGKGRQEIARLLDFLSDYVVRHFAAEERQMDSLQCPVAEANKLAHAEFLEVFKSLQRRFEEAGATPSLVLEIKDTLSRWLVDHISRIDTKLNECVVV